MVQAHIRKQGGRRRVHWRRLEGYAFIAPLFVGIVSFMVVPVVSSLYLSFHNWDMIDAPRFIGIRNYVSLLTRDRLFWSVLGNTLKYAGMSIPPAVVLPLVLAVLVNRRIRGISLYRTAFFLPLVTSTVAVGLVWRWIYDKEFGLANYLLRWFGIEGPAWLFDPTWAMPAVVAVGIWHGLGYNMLIYLAGLQDIGEPLYEAAKIDGAGTLARFFRITIPLLTPQMFFILVMSVIGGFQSFGLIYVMTRGGPMNATNVYVYYLWETAFGSSRMGYASAMAWILAVIIFTVTFVQVRLSSAWVYH